jgi:hypothetical protein
MMKEKIKNITNDLTYDETQELLKKVEGIFKGGVTFKNTKDYKQNMINYYRATQMMGM